MGDVQRIPGIYLCVSDEPDSPFQRWLKANRRNPGQNPVLPKWVAVPNRRRLPDLSLPVIGHHSPRLYLPTNSFFVELYASSIHLSREGYPTLNIGLSGVHRRQVTLQLIPINNFRQLRRQSVLPSGKAQEVDQRWKHIGNDNRKTTICNINFVGN